ncbi:Ethylene-responsive transcription factor [Nymphaea thermarum]|nr:Ethylene-responsive transcription factor [Nymphaea thermarum]
MQRDEGIIAGMNARNPYRGVRRRKWGKWVSEVRLPGSRDRLWLGSYSTPEAAAVAHDTAVFCLRGPSAVSTLNFPCSVSPYLRLDMSPKSVRRAAAEAGMAADKELAPNMRQEIATEGQLWGEDHLLSRGQVQSEEELSISADDMEILL